ncbi:MAG: hypothetical protein ACD_28C00108G0014 [uncultured bacterium]|nr:MAG: hypothetical protein ACD_28C00108G0014 [uncultured bacterium]KKT76090.1 MAG: hypothetical protein UW70_C0022G0007 [Candidatus Peregrinibacteria bacterium GW2011_GWA2_44_7]
MPESKPFLHALPSNKSQKISTESSLMRSLEYELSELVHTAEDERTDKALIQGLRQFEKEVQMADPNQERYPQIILSELATLGEVVQELKPFEYLNGNETFEIKHRAQCLMRDALIRITTMNETIMGQYQQEILERESSREAIKAISVATEARFKTLKYGKKTSTTERRDNEKYNKEQIAFQEEFNATASAVEKKWDYIQKQTDDEKRTKMAREFAEDEQRNLLKKLQWRMNGIERSIKHAKIGVDYFTERVAALMKDVISREKRSAQSSANYSLQTASA